MVVSHLFHIWNGQLTEINSIGLFLAANLNFLKHIFYLISKNK